MYTRPKLKIRYNPEYPPRLIIHINIKNRRGKYILKKLIYFPLTWIMLRVKIKSWYNFKIRCPILTWQGRRHSKLYGGIA